MHGDKSYVRGSWVRHVGSVVPSPSSEPQCNLMLCGTYLGLSSVVLIYLITMTIKGGAAF